MSSSSTPKPKPWSRSDIPDLSGKVCIVTGSTRGIGYETALGLVQANAGEVILVGRNVEKGNEALEKMKGAANSNSKTIISFSTLDLGSLESVAEFAK
jgi:NAD(P)-dependent dehydrogenase (short-subunit alcohol dehydrogenase family)